MLRAAAVSVARRLKQLNKVAAGVYQQDLGATWSCHHVIAESHAVGPQARDLRWEVVNDQVNAIPSARSRAFAVRHRAPRRTRRSADQKPKRAKRNVCECRSPIVEQGEAQMLRVPRNGRIYVVDQVSNIHDRR
jgi:hypothetical protein